MVNVLPYEAPSNPEAFLAEPCRRKRGSIGRSVRSWVVITPQTNAARTSIMSRYASPVAGSVPDVVYLMSAWSPSPFRSLPN